MRKFIAVSLTAMLTLGSAQTAMAEVIEYNLSENDLMISTPPRQVTNI